MPLAPALSWPRVLRAGSRWRKALPLPAAALLLFQLGASAGGALTPPGPPAVLAAGAATEVTQGALRVTRGGEVVECPLRHTDVRAEISGFIARVRVTQTFDNPYDEALEAVYVFPLPHGSAVDEMTMVVGERRITGLVQRRQEARETYEQAIAAGHTAALLEQERPNIFTQTVGNIPPRKTVRVEIAYVDVLPYDDGRYEFHFPMVVGPRYIPGRPTGRQGAGWAPDTTRVPDASRITPPVLEPGFRTGHDVSLTLALEAGVPIRGLRVHDHLARVERAGTTRATVTLSPADSIPNKDFVLSYHVAGERPQTAVLSHAAEGEDGHFLLMVQPREMEEALRASPPRDVCFLIDVSGSMSGEPIAKVAEAMERFFARMRPQDRLQVVTFAGAAATVFPGYVPASRDNIAQALAVTRRMEGGGGTEMLEGIRAVLAGPVDAERLRVVVMLTDGYIGNEDEIIGEVGRRAGDQIRFWTVGIGSSPNRHLLDGVARQGGGASAVLGLRDDPAPLVDRAMNRIQRAQLARLQIDWSGLDVFETYPARLGELWAGKPVFLLGRYRGQGEGHITLSGLAEGEPVSFEVPVSLAGAGGSHAVLASAWARKKIEHLADQMAVAGESGELVEEVTALALRHRLMSAYTSFVAVDESEVVEGGRPPRRVAVPVPLPDGVSYEGVFGKDEERVEVTDAVRGHANVTMALAMPASPMRAAKALRRTAGAALAPVPEEVAVSGLEGGVVGGTVGGVPGGVVGGAPVAPPPPPYARTMADALVGAGEPRRRTREEDARLAAYVERARTARADAARLKTAGDLDGSAAALAMAALAEQVRAAAAGFDDGRLASVLAELTAANAAREERAARKIPTLGRPLALVLRNTDVASALEAIARAAGVRVRVEPGSTDAAAAAFGARALRVAYLDLRGLTAAQALTCVTQPAALLWTLEAGSVHVRPGAWASGPEMLRGTPEANAGVKPARATARARRDLALWSWRLLAAALDGGSDEAATSHLLEAWRAPGVAAADTLTLRSLWTLSVARAASPNDATLAQAWDAALAAARPVLGAAPALKLPPEAALYALLLRSKAPAALAIPDPELPAAGPYASIGRLLLGRGGDAGEVLEALTRGEVRGDDALVLSAAALRIRGGDPWTRFREAAAELAHVTGASGGALQVANHME